MLSFQCLLTHLPVVVMGDDDCSGLFIISNINIQPTFKTYNVQGHPETMLAAGKRNDVKRPTYNMTRMIPGRTMFRVELSFDFKHYLRSVVQDVKEPEFWIHFREATAIKFRLNHAKSVCRPLVLCYPMLKTLCKKHGAAAKLFPMEMPLPPNIC